MTDYNKNEITTEEKTELTTAKYLQDCKDKLTEYDEEQRILGNKINHWIGVINRTGGIRIG